MVGSLRNCLLIPGAILSVMSLILLVFFTWRGAVLSNIPVGHLAVQGEDRYYHKPAGFDVRTSISKEQFEIWTTYDTYRGWAIMTGIVGLIVVLVVGFQDAPKPRDSEEGQPITKQSSDEHDL